jgi:hypothetical protein
MYVRTISRGKRIARKPHNCFHCRRNIEIGQEYEFEVNFYDEVYTLKYHLDCNEMSDEYSKVSEYYFICDDGWPPLRDMMLHSGEYEQDCNNWRGLYPHVIARMELTDQLRANRPTGQKEE